MVKPWALERGLRGCNARAWPVFRFALVSVLAGTAFVASSAYAGDTKTSTGCECSQTLVSFGTPMSNDDLRVHSGQGAQAEMADAGPELSIILWDEFKGSGRGGGPPNELGMSGHDTRSTITGSLR